mmetsp:Transcript_33705/g.64496  ORF Transcript_33705/g.64496 Transcript_33705/m.64496 type:complete len:246 (+) Transcript_33705:790-1527(+)
MKADMMTGMLERIVRNEVPFSGNRCIGATFPADQWYTPSPAVIQTKKPAKHTEYMLVHFIELKDLRRAAGAMTNTIMIPITTGRLRAMSGTVPERLLSNPGRCMPCLLPAPTRQSLIMSRNTTSRPMLLRVTQMSEVSVQLVPRLPFISLPKVLCCDCEALMSMHALAQETRHTSADPAAAPTRPSVLNTYGRAIIPEPITVVTRLKVAAATDVPSLVALASSPSPPTHTLCEKPEEDPDPTASP